ncbi:MAG: hypothetical protein IJ796_03475 [Lachnospiraceae bacterium]|nr:hypothetical protein [Lachnospiraceae bacterium]
MKEQTGSNRYKTIQRISKSAANEVTVCRDENDNDGTLVTVLAVEDHNVMRRFIEIYDKADYIEENTVLDMFSDEGRFFIVYPYVQERALKDFYMGNAMSLHECEETCVNLIIACMTSSLPWPVLYLVLKQREIQLARDNSITLSYRIDLTELDVNVGESQCAIECAKILTFMLESKARRKANSYVLLRKKTEKFSYGSFKELYKDVEIAAEPPRKNGFFASLKAWFSRNKTVLFRILLWTSIILAVFVLITFITNLIFGDVPWLRLFIRSFEKIGLESLLQ